MWAQGGKLYLGFFAGWLRRAVAFHSGVCSADSRVQWDRCTQGVLWGSGGCRSLTSACALSLISTIDVALPSLPTGEAGISKHGATSNQTSRSHIYLCLISKIKEPWWSGASTFKCSSWATLLSWLLLASSALAPPEVLSTHGVAVALIPTGLSLVLFSHNLVHPLLAWLLVLDILPSKSFLNTFILLPLRVG